jgi:hypothetical protein
LEVIGIPAVFPSPLPSPPSASLLLQIWAGGEKRGKRGSAGLSELRDTPYMQIYQRDQQDPVGSHIFEADYFG